MKRRLKKLMDEVNMVIHRENLYIARQGGNRRVYNAQVLSGEVVVEDLHTGELYPVLGESKFSNGYGSEVIFQLEAPAPHPHYWHNN